MVFSVVRNEPLGCLHKVRALGSAVTALEVGAVPERSEHADRTSAHTAWLWLFGEVLKAEVFLACEHLFPRCLMIHHGRVSFTP